MKERKWIALPLETTGVAAWDEPPGTVIRIKNIRGNGGPVRFFELRRRDVKNMCYYARALTEEEEVRAMKARDYVGGE